MVDEKKKQAGKPRIWRRSILLTLFAGLFCLALTLTGLSSLAFADFAGEPGSEREKQQIVEGGDPWLVDPWDDSFLEDKQEPGLADPLEPLNRVFFRFNDRLYFWVLSPTARAYAEVVPEDIRLCFRRFFHNLVAPVRVANHLLQGQLKASGSELARFVINSTIGIGGLADPAANSFGLEHRAADLGQTLGIYGFGDGFFIVWPLLGPSTLRDSLGKVGDSLVSPTGYLMAADWRAVSAFHVTRAVNDNSLRLGEYERMIQAALDPYLAVRDAYWQFRRHLIRERGQGSDQATIFSAYSGFGPDLESIEVRSVLKTEIAAGVSK